MSAEQDIDSGLQSLLETIWEGRWIIAGVTALFAISAGVAATFTPSKYTAVTVVSPVINDQNGALGGLSSIASSFGTIASLAGISMGSSASARAETIALLQSNVLSESYIRENNLLPILFAKQWNAAEERWTVPDAEVPTLWIANELFRDEVVGISENAKSGLVTLSVTWTDPALAARWANDLVRLANDYLRAQAIEKSERHIQYLNDQAAKTDIAQVRTAIYAIMESEIKNVMLAKGTDEYALKVIDPAVAPERRSSPKRTVWVIAGFLCGLSLSLLIVFARKTWRV